MTKRPVDRIPGKAFRLLASRNQCANAIGRATAHASDEPKAPTILATFGARDSNTAPTPLSSSKIKDHSSTVILVGDSLLFFVGLGDQAGVNTASLIENLVLAAPVAARLL